MEMQQSDFWHLSLVLFIVDLMGQQSQICGTNSNSVINFFWHFIVSQHSYICSQFFDLAESDLYQNSEYLFIYFYFFISMIRFVAALIN